MPEHEELVLSVGPYLLGALDPETRRQLRDHLDTCQLCRDELVRLAAVPGFLAQASPRRVEPEAEPPSGLRARLVQQVIAEREAKRRRAQQLAVAAVTLLILLPVGVATGLRIGTSGATSDVPPVVTETASPQAPDYQQMATTPSSGALRGEISWVAHSWGVELNLATWGARPNERLVLFAESRDGRVEQAAVWQTVPDRRIPCTGQSSILEQDMGRVVVKTEAGEEVLVLDLT